MYVNKKILLPLVEMDQSMTSFHLRYFWKASKFFGNELICCKFTNTKAWILSSVSMFTSDTILHTTSFCPFLIQSVYYTSLAAFFFETIGVLFRATELYSLEWHLFCNCCEFDEDRRKKFYGKDL